MNIEDLKVERLTMREVKNDEGIMERKKVRVMVKRPVEVTGQGQRFIHYLVDRVLIFVINMLLGAAFGFVIAVAGGMDETAFTLISYVIGLTGFVLYYYFSESATQTSLGKKTSKSIVINEFAGKPSTRQIWQRSLSRIVPFEPFSCFAERGWHDKWSKTWVVTKDERDKLAQLLEEQGGIVAADEPGSTDDLLDSGL